MTSNFQGVACVGSHKIHTHPFVPMSHESTSTPSRREFLRRTTGALAVAGAVRSFKTPVYGQNQAPSANVIGANDKIVCGYIGVGGQGSGAHVGQSVAHFKENNIALAAVCDVSKHRVQAAKKQIAEGGAGDAEGFEDYRKLLARKDIDAIFCATVVTGTRPCPATPWSRASMSMSRSR